MGNDVQLSTIEQTKVDNYILTAGEQKLIQTMLNPENTGISIVELCKLSGISRDTYYSAMKKPEFVKLYQETVLSIIKNEAYPLIKVGLREAKRGSFQHWKVLLEMAGLYSEKSTLEVTGEVILSQDERRSRIADLLSKRQIAEAIDTTYSVVPENEAE